MKKRGFGIFGLLSALLAAMSIASLIVRIFDVGLAPVTQDILEYYRWFIGQVRFWFFDWWTIRWMNFQVPAWGMDTFTIWSILWFSVARSGPWAPGAFSPQPLAQFLLIGRDAEIELWVNSIKNFIGEIIRYAYLYPAAPLLFAKQFVFNIKALPLALWRRIIIDRPALSEMRKLFRERGSRIASWPREQEFEFTRLYSKTYSDSYSYQIYVHRIRSQISPFILTGAFFVWNSIMLNPA